MKRKTRKNSIKEFYQANNYTCEKLTFISWLDAINGIRNDGEANSLRPYKCERCSNWHLTHLRNRTLFHTKKATSKRIRPCDIIYKTPTPAEKKGKLIFRNKLR
jgi:hypothetical protein